MMQMLVLLNVLMLTRTLAQYPTWPVEWVQISVLLAYMDYWSTGSADLAASFMDDEAQSMGGQPANNLTVRSLFNNTRIVDADKKGPTKGLLNCSAQVSNGCSTRPGAGHHIGTMLAADACCAAPVARC